MTERVLSQREIKRLQNQVLHSQKMETLGLMAGGVAHDLNNILSGIVSYPELILMDLPEGSPLRKPIETIQESGMRAADVVEDLLTVARGGATGKIVSNLNTLIEGYLNSAEHQKLAATQPSVIFKTELDPDLLNMGCSPTHIKKILMNLIANASEALEGSGTVTISTTNQYVYEPLKGYEAVRIGEYAVLAVSDDGSGISPGDLERIFWPFYTKDEERQREIVYRMLTTLEYAGEAVSSGEEAIDKSRVLEKIRTLKGELQKEVIEGCRWSISVFEDVHNLES